MATTAGLHNQPAKPDQPYSSRPVQGQQNGVRGSSGANDQGYSRGTAGDQGYSRGTTGDQGYSRGSNAGSEQGYGRGTGSGEPGYGRGRQSRRDQQQQQQLGVDPGRAGTGYGTGN